MSAEEKCHNAQPSQDKLAVWKCNKPAGHDGQHAYQTPFGNAVVSWS